MDTHRTSPAVLALLALLALFAVVAFGAAPSPLDSLARTERDFARLSVEQGIDIAFDANFAEDGISFSPHPVKRREEIARRPAAKTKQDFILDWYPTLSDVSAAGDLGYNTGPWIIADRSEQKRPPEHGYFFSVWKRQAEGAWKVAVDVGIEVSEPSTTEVAASWRGARCETYTPTGEVSLDAERETLRRRERELGQAVASKGLAAAYAESLASDFRVYRNGQLPFFEKAALASRLQAEQARGLLAWESTSVDVARSADLAYTWGSYSLTAKAATEPLEMGYYVHVWRRSAHGEWRLAIEAMRPLPPPPPPPADGRE